MSSLASVHKHTKIGLRNITGCEVCDGRAGPTAGFPTPLVRGQRRHAHRLCQDVDRRITAHLAAPSDTLVNRPDVIDKHSNYPIFSLALLLTSACIITPSDQHRYNRIHNTYLWKQSASHAALSGQGFVLGKSKAVLKTGHTLRSIHVLG